MSSAAVTVIDAPGDHVSMGALGGRVGLLQQLHSHPPASEVNTESCHPAPVAALAAIMSEQLGTSGTDTGVNSVAHTHQQNTPAMGQHSQEELSVTRDVYQQRQSPVRANRHLTNRATLKQRHLKLFKTVSHAQIIWNSETKPKGILGGHINIRSILPKIDQIQNLLTDSNLDFLCISETWLTSNVPTNLINIPGYNATGG